MLFVAFLVISLQAFVCVNIIFSADGHNYISLLYTERQKINVYYKDILWK